MHRNQLIILYYLSSQMLHIRMLTDDEMEEKATIELLTMHARIR